MPTQFPHLALVLHVLLPFLFAGAGLALALSRRFRRYVRGTGSLQQTASNTSVGLLFLLSQTVLRGVMLGVYSAVSSAVPWRWEARAWWGYLLAFVLLDFVYYVQHRLEHQVPVLWAIHSVHHQSVDYNWSVSFRVGMLASLSTMCFHALVALAGVDLVTYAAVSTAHAALLFTLHARTKFTLGPGRFFNAPVFHRVHHASNEEAIDRNFGGVLLLFDRLFGTFTPYREGLVYGVSGEPAPQNPVSANVAPWSALLATVAKQPTLGAKVRALFVR